MQRPQSPTWSDSSPRAGPTGSEARLIATVRVRCGMIGCHERRRRRHRRRSGLGRAGRRRRARRRRPQGDPPRPGARDEPRWAGALVVRWTVPGRLPRAAPDGHQGLPRPGLAGLAGHRRVSTGAEDEWPRRWAEAYVDFAAGEKRSWLHEQGLRLFPVVGWAERGGYLADGPGNSVPRFHITWGTGPGVVAPFERRVLEAASRGTVSLRFRHRVDELVVSAGAVTGVRGAVLDAEQRGSRRCHLPRACRATSSCRRRQ